MPTEQPYGPNVHNVPQPQITALFSRKRISIVMTQQSVNTNLTHVGHVTAAQVLAPTTPTDRQTDGQQMRF